MMYRILKINSVSLDRFLFFLSSLPKVFSSKRRCYKKKIKIIFAKCSGGFMEKPAVFCECELVSLD